MQVFSIPPTLPYYREPGAMTSPGRYAALFDDLPEDVAQLAAVAQGLIIHEHLTHLYDVTLSAADRGSVHVRPVEDLLGLIAAQDPRPLRVAREPAARIAGNCRHFSVMMVAMLRFRGIPARARCGFGAYFVDGLFEDHWVCEYWDGSSERWKLVDGQIDDAQRGLFGIGFDLTDVPRDEFVIAGDAWVRCREGAADPAAFGLSFLKEAGSWWIAANLMRDAASLDNLELLPWDCWGVMPEPDVAISADDQVLFDQLAGYTRLADDAFELRQRLCAEDERIRVPQRVRNVVRGTDEPITRQLC